MVRRRIALILAVFMAALPFAGRAQTTEEKKPAGPTITPYGFILLNAFFNSRPFAADDYPQYALAAPTATNDRGILLSNRYNRFGVRIGGAEAMGAKLNAVLELDFGFGFAVPAGTNTNQTQQAVNFDFYRPLARMRIGYVTATWELDPESKVTLLLGEDYGLVNPLFATTVGYIGTPLFQNAGNLYTRSPGAQLKLDYGKANGLTLAVAVLDPMDQNADARTGQNQETPTLSSGNKSRIPQLEARLAGRYKEGPYSGEVGVSGSYHKERYALGNFTEGNPIPGNANPAASSFAANGRYVDLDSQIAGVDALLKFPYFEVRGEGFIGHNVDMYYGHLGQGGVNPVLGTAAAVTPATTPATFLIPLTNVTNKRTKGFWAQGILSPLEWVQLVGGYGVETPFFKEIAVGQRARNSIAQAGIIFLASKNLKFSAEGAYTYTALKAAGNKETATNGYQTVLSSQYTF